MRKQHKHKRMPSRCAADDEPNELANDAEETPKPKRGRPPKNKSPEQASGTEPSPPAGESKLKKRGRPRREEVDGDTNEEDAEPARPKRRNKEPVVTNEDHAEQSSPSTEQPRPSKANRRAAKKLNEAQAGEADAEEASAANAGKKKRGRPAKVVEEQPEEEPEPETAPKKKRGRPSLNKEALAEEQDATQEESIPKKRGRKPKDKLPETEEPAVEEQEETREESVPKKRGRKPKEKAVETEEPTAEEEEATETVPNRKRGRPAAEVQDQPSPEREAPAKKKRGRPSLQSQEDSQETSHAEPKEPRRRKPGQPSPAEDPSADKPTKRRRKRPSQGEEQEEPSPDSERRRRGRPRKSDTPQSPEEQASKPRKSKKRSTGDALEQQPNNSEEQASKPRKSKKRPSEDASEEQPKKGRRRNSGDREQQQQEPPTPKSRLPTLKHHHITTRMRHISRSTMEEKWSPLAPSSLSLISNILHVAERPVLQRLKDNDKRRESAASVMRGITNRLNRKLSRGMPFPPASVPPRAGASAAKKQNEDNGRLEEFDFERIVDSIASLERQLDPAIHAVELLKKEKELAEKALEEEYESLKKLEANAKSEARHFKDNLRKTHVLIPEHVNDGSRRDGDFKFVPGENVGGTLFKDLEDEELRGLAGQVGSHMESMRNNLQQIEGVVPQIGKSRAALQDVLFKHLDQQSYENVLFG
ncbi:hypothetical protein CkaCkLH20_08070 [Colletotrichum karsti]|uniref:Kinetochore protein fta7 n=1 Tax=Colletotrichum karsti TaxID=1095194 RepID=A0A9P6I2E1_9PEZI|nr:uncharacterized protein CkaCkLH20_08070 [Colletotrichum karsti]KAF9874507.1 hypothetical protein CkaCkLH20_08070 [Colletotrichum karsti]